MTIASIEIPNITGCLHPVITHREKKASRRGLWVGLVLKCGEVNLRTMELPDAGNTGTYGHPVPTSVPLGTKKGRATRVAVALANACGRRVTTKPGPI